jgi:Cu/Ag efflux protein CusF
MNIKNLTVILSLSIIFSACQKTVKEIKLPTENSTTANIANISPNSTVTENTKTKLYDGTGVVTKINLELVSVELKHEEIKGLMPAMQMEFYVSDKKFLEDLKVGDKVDFVLENSANGEKIVSIKKK